MNKDKFSIEIEQIREYRIDPGNPNYNGMWYETRFNIFKNKKFIKSYTDKKTAEIKIKELRKKSNVK